MRPHVALATSLMATASIAAFAQEPKLAPEGRGLLPKPAEMPATLGGTPPPHPFQPDPSGGLSRTIFETDEGPDFKIVIRDFAFPPDRQPHTVTLPSGAFLRLLSGDGEITVAKQRMELTPPARKAVPAGAPIEVVNNGERAIVVRGGEIAMRTILGWTATLISFSAVLVTAACGPPPPPPPPPPVLNEWYTYRYDVARTGVQPRASALSDPNKVGALAVKGAFPADGQSAVGGFVASPILLTTRFSLAVQTDISMRSMPPAARSNGSTPGHRIRRCSAHAFLAITAFNPARYARIGGQDAVIFGAQDPSAKGALGARDFSH